MAQRLVILLFWPMRASSLHEGLLVKLSVVSASSSGQYQNSSAFGSGAVLHRSVHCVTLHTVGIQVPAPQCLMHEAYPRLGATHLKRGSLGCQ